MQAGFESRHIECCFLPLHTGMQPSELTRLPNLPHLQMLLDLDSRIGDRLQMTRLLTMKTFSPAIQKVMENIVWVTYVNNNVICK